MCKYKKIMGASKDAFYCELKNDLDWLATPRICEGCEHNRYQHAIEIVA